METKELYKAESYGTYGGFLIEIKIGATKLPDTEGDDAQPIRFAAMDAAKLIQGAVMEAVIKSDPEAIERAKRERSGLLECFSGGDLFVEEIPNGYCSDYCCKHLPWFIVTTKAGRIKIGWRKRVINIDWEGTPGTKTSEEMFPGEETTKYEKSIHAWSYDDAKRYITAIIESAS